MAVLSAADVGERTLREKINTNADRLFAQVAMFTDPLDTNPL